MMLVAALFFAGVLQENPLDFAQAELRQTLGPDAAKVHLEIRKNKAKETYTITPKGDQIQITGSDPTGAMYGAFEFAERVKREGPKAWQEKAQGKPFMAQRGVNLFLTLPWDYKRNDTDDSVDALTDPKRWWFQDEHYWTTLLDLMAHSRLNWLDIHGAWDISVTDAPNLYAYFVKSPSFPLVGVPDDVKAANLRQLNHVIGMAHARGIKVSLMAYEAKFHTPQNPNPPYKSTEENLYKYTREAVAEMLRQTPGLDAIGFRIGESGHRESFFNCYQEALKESGRDIPLITRTWITTKPNVVALARKAKDFTAEIKFNGEQWGAPYIVTGGRMANWGSYSYEDYLSDSGPGQAAKMWQGLPAQGGGNWPAEPYKIVWQVRVNGTHRIFPFYNPDWVRRSIRSMALGTTNGYTVEGEDAYFPKDPLYYLANPADKYVDYIHQRDELFWMTWGRLGYDPDTPDSTFDAVVSDWFGAEHGPEIAKIWKQMSTVVPLIYMAHALGPDHRDHAPELETGGDTAAFDQIGGLDPLVFLPGNEQFIEDGRIIPPETSSLLIHFTGKTLGNPGASDYTGRLKELDVTVKSLSDLAHYYSARFKGVPPAIAYDSLLEAEGAWQRLSQQPFYRPFTDRLRMHTNTFQWKDQYPLISGWEKAAAPGQESMGTRGFHFGHGSDYDLFQVLVQPEPPPDPWTQLNDSFLLQTLGLDQSLRAKPDYPSLEAPTIKTRLSWQPKGNKILVREDGDLANQRWFLYKPLPSSTFYHRARLEFKDGHNEATLPRPNCGLCLSGPLGLIIPSKDTPAPYLVVPARPGPTPRYYATNEALTYLDPAVLTPDKFGTILIAPRAAQFFAYPNAQKRKLLEAVKNGMKLVIMQQDFLGRRYPLDFLPNPPKAVPNPTPNQSDGGGAFGINLLAAPGIQLQRFERNHDWETYGSGAFAMNRYGKGEIWLCTQRLMQTDQFAAAQTFIKAATNEKPAILVDAGTESPVFTTSYWPDLLNWTNSPFLTLGEVIAQEQGGKSTQPIPGPVATDNILDGKGVQMANAFLRNQVIAAAKRPTPSTVEAFEKVRKERKVQLLQTLGLDPMPAKTPLNSRSTGYIQGNGYFLEKVVIESRPHFYVTMHVYRPGKIGQPQFKKLPLIVNVNGHWAHKKDEDRIQLRCAFQAEQGYIAVALDSPGWSFEGDSLIERRAEGSHNDFKLLEGGANATGYYVWDSIRALDYMATLPEVDMDRIGITGASGGGLATLYAFAADDRYKAAVPVVYMASMEMAPDNGCLCNHVPGTLQIGDRSDVISVQAPKPVLLMAAQNDGEFPAQATVHTRDKMAQTWALFGKADDTYVKVFPGGHDYNQGMRESMMGFFNRYVRGDGDGKPVPQPPLTAIDPNDHNLLVLDPPASNELTMRDLALQALKQAPKDVSPEQAIALNGGIPAESDTRLKITGTGRVRTVTFEAQPGFVTPGVLYLPKGKVTRLIVLAKDQGKSDALAPQTIEGWAKEGSAVLMIDLLGTGELAGFEQRYTTYLGESAAFVGGWQFCQAAKAFSKTYKKIQILGWGPLCSQAVMWAGFMRPESFELVSGYGCPVAWQDVFQDSAPDVLVQPRAQLMGDLRTLMLKVKHSYWSG